MSEKPDLKVVEFKPRKTTQRTYECNCGRQDFWLNEDGSIECRGCHVVLCDKKWVSLNV